MPETEADIVPEFRIGMFVWFAGESGGGFREIELIEPWQAEPYTWNYGLAEDWVTITYTDGHVEERVRYGTHEIWKSGPRPMVGAQ